MSISNANNNNIDIWDTYSKSLNAWDKLYTQTVKQTHNNNSIRLDRRLFGFPEGIRHG